MHLYSIMGNINHSRIQIKGEYLNLPSNSCQKQKTLHSSMSLMGSIYRDLRHGHSAYDLIILVIADKATTVFFLIIIDLNNILWLLSWIADHNCVVRYEKFYICVTLPDYVVVLLELAITQQIENVYSLV